MSREYNCKKCQQTHPPPTGKKCSRSPLVAATAASSDDDSLTNVILSLTEVVSKVTARLDDLESRSSSSRHGTPNSRPGVTNPCPSTATAATLRADSQLQQAVRQRMSELQLAEFSNDTDEDNAPVPRASKFTNLT